MISRTKRRYLVGIEPIVKCIIYWLLHLFSFGFHISSDWWICIYGACFIFTAHSDLTAEELKEFAAKRFTLGQIPLKPPPADLLVV